MCIICPSLKPPLKTPYHKAQIEALILLIFIFISHLQHPFPGTAEPCLFPGLRVNNHSLLPCGHKSIIIDLAQVRAALARCTRGALTLTFPPRWGNKGETTSCATWLGKTNKSQYMKATTATESTFSSPEAKHWSGNDGIHGVSGRGEQSSCAEGSQHNHIHPCGVFQAGRKPCFQRSGCNWDRAAADHAVPRGVQCCPLGDAATKTTGLCVIWRAPPKMASWCRKPSYNINTTQPHTQCYHWPVLMFLGVLEKPLPTVLHLPRKEGLSYPPPPHEQGETARGKPALQN